MRKKIFHIMFPEFFNYYFCFSRFVFLPYHNSLIFVHNVETYLLQTLCVLFMLNGINYNMVYEKMYSDVNLLQNI